MQRNLSLISKEQTLRSTNVHVCANGLLGFGKTCFHGTSAWLDQSVSNLLLQCMTSLHRISLTLQLTVYSAAPRFPSLSDRILRHTRTARESKDSGWKQGCKRYDNVQARSFATWLPSRQLSGAGTLGQTTMSEETRRDLAMSIPLARVSLLFPPTTPPFSCRRSTPIFLLYASRTTSVRYISKTTDSLTYQGCCRLSR